ncbi:MAG: MBOAT family O-acyltransferase [Verrucomicrobiota bacterium]
MLFNSYVFLLLFLPLAIIGYRWAGGLGLRLGAAWLSACSLVYYASWNANPGGDWTPWPLALIVTSILANYGLARGIARHRDRPAGRVLVWLGVAGNLAFIGWFKYAIFFARIATDAGLPAPDLPTIILPLGISFFTFQQIAFLIDARQGKVVNFRFGDYFLFVMFFPQLVAGPIVHHGEMMPQFATHRRANNTDLAVGITILSAGLFKKVVIADTMARDASKFFDYAAIASRELTFAEGWCAAFLYALQLYFDFSGYSDMAIGAARCFGIRLPENFCSPYKATSIVDFWRRWHMTLSRFLRDYLYIGLGGNRGGPSRRYANLFVTMLLGGLWHGAGFMFVLWGAAHGLLLGACHAYTRWREHLGWRAMPRPLAITLTLLTVVILWVPFRAGTLEIANPDHAWRAVKNIWGAMFGFHGFESWPSSGERVTGSSKALRFIPVLLVALLLPNTQQWMARYRPVHGRSLANPDGAGPLRWWHWRPSRAWFIFSVVLLLVIGLEFNKVSEFIYFQF